MSNNVSFNVGEIVWGKIRGFPWWPALITGTEDDIREKKYTISFIGDNTHASVQKKNLAKFDKEYKQYSNTKKKDLVESIKKAKEMFENKNGAKDKEIESLMRMKNNNKDKEREKDKEKLSSNEGSYDRTKDKSNGSKKEENNNEQNIIYKKKNKKVEAKAESELIFKIVNYLRHISAVLIKKDSTYDFEKNKNNLCKIFKYLAEYKIQEPIEFLKKTNLGKYIKFINDNVQNEEIKQATNEVYKNFESQVLTQLFKQK